ncbi:unnamed protein product [Rhodiola kirilowii]
MRALAWNCRGLGQPRTVRELADLVGDFRPQVIGLQETKMERRKLEAIRRRLGFSCGFSVERNGLAGGLALWWKEEVDLRILSYSSSHIDSYVEDDKEFRFRITLFYGEPVTHKRQDSWDLLRLLNKQLELPWVIFGDFNEVCFGWEVRGTRIRGEWQMKSFREALFDCGLTDLGFKGSPFTFSNKRRGAMEVKARLDRVLANADWRDAFPFAQVTHITTCTSDHYSLLIDLLTSSRKHKSRSFKFEPMWLRQKDFGDVVKEAWQNSGGDSQSLTSRLQQCGEYLKRWNGKVFGPVKTKMRNLKDQLEVIRMKPREESVVKEEEYLVSQLKEWRLREEIYWRQRSREEWLKEGDRNTKFFHAKASHRRKINSLEGIKDSSGRWLKEEKEIAEQVRSYFGGLFESSIKGRNIDWNQRLLDVQRRVPVGSEMALCGTVTELEVKAALFQMYPTKAPGPDGFSAIFFQKHWHLLKDTITRRISMVINAGKFEEGMNETLIVLIPKCKRPSRLEEYRPISLCNVTAKIVTKILANRLKTVLPLIISDSQSAFIPGKQISDNILLAHEVLHYIKSRRKQKKGYFSLKIDMSKAYDRVEWGFLEEVQRKMGFPDRWISLIMECVRSVKYKVKLNDGYVEIPQPERGLRQGDPLSPYLFLLCSEWLSSKLEADTVGRRLKGVRICRGAPVISHLFFADDSIFFLKATRQNAIRIKRVLEEYEFISGQKINLGKSEVVFSRNVRSEERKEIRDILMVSVAENHSRYLGLPVSFSHNRTELFRYLIDRLWRKVMGWKELQLSAAGKEVMIKAVLQSIPQYAMMCYKIPDGICKRLAGIIRRFWWSFEAEGRGVHWTNQVHLTLSKEDGGLSFRNLVLFNEALLAKQVWRLLVNPSSLTSRVLKAKYFRDGNVLSASLCCNPSLAWRSVWQVGQKIKDNISWNEEEQVWRWTADGRGVFSTKLVYMKMKADYESMTNATKGECSDKTLVRSFWKHLWRMKMQGKVKIFMWRLFHDFLPSSLNLVKRGCGSDLCCKVCGFGVESTIHVMLDCWWAQSFWRTMKIDCGFLDIKFSSTGDWLWYCFQHQPHNELTLLCYGVRLIWYNRNLLAHGKEGLQIEAASLSARASVANIFKPGFRFTVSGAEGSSSWEAPAKAYIKINCDGSWDPRTKDAGFGCVARDEEGTILGVLAESTEDIHSAEAIEVLAISRAMEWAGAIGWHKCIFETDCGEVYSIISQFKVGSASESALATICQWNLVREEDWSVALVRREANVLADYLANKARREKWSWNSGIALPRLPGSFALSESVLV